MVSIMSQSIVGVEVHIKARQHEDGEAIFVRWTTGRLQFDDQLEMTIYVDEGTPKPMEKKLGRLIEVTALKEDDSGRSLGVHATLSGMKNIYRFMFTRESDARTVYMLGEKASKEEEEIVAAETADRIAKHKELIDAVKKFPLLHGRRPLLYPEVQLLGPGPSDDADEVGSEVTLGDGVLALLDSKWRSDADGGVAVANSIGSYELLFFAWEDVEADMKSPSKRFEIEPKMNLQVLDRERAEFDGEEEAAKSFTLESLGNAFTFAFESLEVADEFERDFTPRQHLLTVGWSKAQKTKEVAKMRKHPVKANVEKFLRTVGLFTLIVCVLAFHFRAVKSGLCYLFC